MPPEFLGTVVVCGQPLADTSLQVAVGGPVEGKGIYEEWLKLPVHLFF